MIGGGTVGAGCGPCSSGGQQTSPGWREQEKKALIAELGKHRGVQDEDLQQDFLYDQVPYLWGGWLLMSFCER